MKTSTIIEQLGFERVVNIHQDNLSEAQTEIISLVKDFGIDQIYFCQDENNAYPAVFLKKTTYFDDPTLKEIAEIHRKAWNYKKVSYLYVYNDIEIRIYNCVETPLFISEQTNFEEGLKKIELVSCKQTDKEQLDTINRIFSAVAIDSGLIWSISEAIDIQKKINLQRRVDQYLVKSLTTATKELMSQGLEIELIHKLILRSLFLLYLEDRKATDELFYKQFDSQATSYFDILENVNTTIALFKKLEECFNGNVFTVGEKENFTKDHLAIIRQCFISGYENTAQTAMFTDWRLFDFSIIQIELLSQIYENLLAEIDPKRKEESGTYYTPPALVELILNEKLPINSKETNYSIKTLDPACGSGIFLVESFKRLVKRYENHHKKKLTDFDKLKELLTENIFGIEYDRNAIKVAAFSLYLALVDYLDPKTLWQGKKLPYLINDPEDKTLKGQGCNLYKRDTIEVNKEIESIEFDLVVGNPPFGTETPTRKLQSSIRNYCDKEGFAKEMVLPFLHKATQFTPKGEIAMIFYTKVLTNTSGTYQNFRKFLLQDCYVEKVYNFSILRKAPKNFGGQLFGDAVGPISIVFYKKEQPENPSNRIVYYAPKTYVKSNVLEGLVIDRTDVKYLPREECQKPDTKIWKIAMWGGMVDFELIESISSRYETLEKRFNENDVDWKYATGLNADSKHLDFVPGKIIDTKKINRYYTPLSSCYQNQKVYRNIKEEYFKPPFVLVKQAQSQKQIAASYVDFNAFCLSSAYVINGDISHVKKKALVAILNSKFGKYFLFMTASSWGIERERASFEEMLSLPYVVDVNNKYIQKISDLVDQIIVNEKSNEIIQTQLDCESIIDEILFDRILKLSKKEQINIHEILEYNLDLFDNQQKSKALFPILETKSYTEMLCSELNEFLEDDNLFANATIYAKDIHNPLCLIKLSFEKTKKNIQNSKENVSVELKKLDKHLWEKESTNIYFRKKLNYYDGDDIYIIRPNQRRFWSQSMAMEDASELILEILNMED